MALIDWRRWLTRGHWCLGPTCIGAVHTPHTGAVMGGSWSARRATPDDGPAIRAVAAAGWRDTYADLLKPETIEAFIDRAYSAERVKARVSQDHVYVVDGPDGIIAFADALERDDHLELIAIYALPDRRGQGAGTALLDMLVALFPDQDISADVVDGNRKGEVWYERRGFAPRERLDTTLVGEPVVERRWWRFTTR